MAKARRMRKEKTKPWLYAVGAVAVAVIVLAVVLFSTGESTPAVGGETSSETTLEENTYSTGSDGFSVITSTVSTGSAEENETSSQVSLGTEVSSSEEQAGSTVQTTGVTFPGDVDEGRLKIHALFQSSILNPDAGNAMATDVASIEVGNISGQHLESAQITVVLSGGTVLEFVLYDLPAGQRAWVFDKNNTVLPKNAACSSVTCTAAYAAETPLMTDELSAEADGTAVTLTNLSDSELGDLTLVFRCLFEEDLYFGGAVYTYSIESISPGESVTLSVDECFLGTAQLVRAQTP
ncbi:MAG: hypothetical protein IKU17_02920 [Clostridia bacterium]|nr:hypothetical protein [Clostridia bacterium]